MWPFKPKWELLAVSKPKSYSMVKNREITFLVYLYSRGTGSKTERKWLAKIGDKLHSATIEPLDVWAATGVWEDPTDTHHFVWVQSPRQLKKKLLAELIAEDTDPPAPREQEGGTL